ncbi:MAG: hypothetical protein AB7U20_25055 [Planctomycetaceae bacterium]
MSRKRFAAVVLGIASLGFVQLVRAGEPAAADRLIVAEAGDLPVLITSPHGGTREIPGVAPRAVREGERINLRRDEETSRLAILTADALEQRLGKRPYLVVADFSRTSLDANRPEATAYQQDAAAPFYRAYHHEIARFVREIREEWKHGLLIDLHAQWQYPEAIMRGTRDGQTIPGLLKRRGWDGLLGGEGLLGSLRADGIRLFPADGESEGQWTHVGSFTVVTYRGEGIDGLQLEIGNDLCDSEEDVRRLASQLAAGIERHLRAEGQLTNVAKDANGTLTVFVDGEQEGRAKAKGAALNEAEQAFVDLLTNSVLVGRFSVDGTKDIDPKPERYAITKVTKTAGDDWVVEARITYGNVDIPVPVPVKVHWAGDTPVISLTDLKIPGLGEGFTTRVLFYEDRYAGSWYHGKAGGHMWGKIEKAGKPPVSDAPPKP